MKTFGAILFLMCAPLIASAQGNLVPNSSFEDSIVCIIGTLRPMNWYSPTSGTPDYFIDTQLGAGGCNDDFPNMWGGGKYANNWGYQLPRTGRAYAGFGIVDGDEYIAVELTDSLKLGKKYCVSAYVSLANNSRSGIDLIEFSFTKNKITRYGGGGLFLDSAESDAGNALSNFILDTANWVLISDTFIAEGGEKFLTIGSFDTAQTQYYLVDSANPSRYAYYYFDDIAVYYCDEPDTVVVQPPDYPEIFLTPNPNNGEMLLTGKFLPNTRIEFFNALGQLVRREDVPEGNIQHPIHANELASGLYLYRIVTPELELRSGKVLISK